MINKVTLVGNLGADPELRHTTGGTAVCNLRVATTSRVKDEDRTEWHRVVCFGKTAEACNQYLAKGRQVYIEGQVQTRQWEKDGQTQYTTEVLAREVKFLGSKGDSSQRNTGSSNNNKQAFSDEDIPF